MNKVLVVTDSRFFMRTFSELLAQTPSINCDYLFFSSDIFEQYLQTQPDTIVLDANVLIPLPSILGCFSEYQWTCRFLVLSQKQKLFFSYPNLLIESMLLTEKSKILDFLQNSSDNPPILYENLDSHAHLYDVLYAVQSGDSHTFSDQKIESLKRQIEILGRLKIFSIGKDDLFILIQKNSPTSKYNLADLHSLICKTLSPNYGSMMKSSIMQSELEKTRETLVSFRSICFFFPGSCLTQEEISKRLATRPHINLDTIMLKLAEHVITSNETAIAEELRKLFFSHIQRHFDYQTLLDTQAWTSFYINLFQMDEDHPTYHNQSFHDEFSLILDVYRRLLVGFSKKKSLPVINKTILFTLHNLQHPLSLQDTASHLGFSKGYLCRIFKKHMGISYIQFLQKLRIQIASYHLQNSSASVRTIAANVGYLDPQYFSKLFKKHTSVFPTEFRTLAKEERDARIYKK